MVTVALRPLAAPLPQRARKLWPALLALTLLPLANRATATAQSRAPLHGRVAEIDYEAPASCPNAAVFTARMLARLSGEPAAPPLPQLQVRIELLGARVRGSIVILEAGVATQRSIETRSCVEAVDGLALIAAIALDSTAKARTIAAPADTSSATPTSSPTAADSVESAAVADRADQVSPGGAPPTASKLQRPEAPKPATSSGLELFATGLALEGVAPRFGVGVQLGASLRVASIAAFDLHARLAARMAFTQRLSHTQGTADFSFWAAALAFCAERAIKTAATSVQGCLLFEPGLLRARGLETRKPASYTTGWAALGPGVWLVWRGLGALNVQAGAELLVPCLRERFWLAQTLVQRAPALGFRLELGLGVQLP